MENSLLPFTFDNIPVRGRLLRLTNVTEACPSLKDEEAATTRTLLNMITAAAVMAHDFKAGSHVGLQIQDPVSGALLVARCNTSGTLRAYANTAAENLNFATLTSNKAAFSVNVTRKDQTYQSFVPLEHESARTAIEAYFSQSVQAATRLNLWTSHQDKQVGCGALFLQSLPDDKNVFTETFADDWRRLGYILDTVTAEEAAGTLSVTDLLRRLFHEDEVRLFPPQPLTFARDNPRERMATALLSLGKQTCLEMLHEGPIEMTDAYTGQQETFNRKDIEAIFKET
jgi:molecular chaperone Hsp33